METTLACLATWMPRQRWYASKGAGAPPALRSLTGWDLPSDDPTARVRIELVVDDSTTPPIVYQVPLVLRAASPPSTLGRAAIIGKTSDGLTIVDGPRDPAYTAALLTYLDPLLAPADAAVVTGEQSNTSVVFTPASGPRVICKVYRRLSAGVNPDIELGTALADAGSPHVPRAIGHADASWPDPEDPRRVLTGTLAFAQEFLPDVEDAWRVALHAGDTGTGFTAAAHALGAATADVHLSLATLFPLVPADDTARAAVNGTWQRRLEIAVAELPALAPYRDAIEAVYAHALATQWPALQRIHGDYHLGQVLQVPGRGWVLLDFEGEPMRPMIERRSPDLALRDVAGMLRSFDYVSGSLHQSRPERDLAELQAWAADARHAFLGGYESRTGQPATGPLLDAFELDKAVYEAIYEARNRPEWLEIPLSAIARLVG